LLNFHFIAQPQKTFKERRFRTEYASAFSRIELGGGGQKSLPVVNSDW